MPDTTQLLWESLKTQTADMLANPNFSLFIVVIGSILILLAQFVGMRTAQDLVLSAFRFLFLLPFKLIWNLTRHMIGIKNS